MKMADIHRHHRRPRSIGGTNAGNNISLVHRDEHMAWHRLFKNFSAQAIAEIISSTWLDPKYKMLSVRADLFEEVLVYARNLEKATQPKQGELFKK